MKQPEIFRAVAFVLIAGVASACGQRSATSNPSIKAQVGIFFGGQIQNRTEWPLVLDETRQTQGFRIDFGQVLRQPAQLTWNIVRPAVKPRRHASSPNESAVSSFEVTVPAGTERLDQLVRFNDGDRPGEWKLHVAVNGISVVDHSIQVVSKAFTVQDD